VQAKLSGGRLKLLLLLLLVPCRYDALEDQGSSSSCGCTISDVCHDASCTGRLGVPSLPGASSGCCCCCCCLYCSTA